MGKKIYGYYSEKEFYLSPCPFCGAEPKITYKGNDHTKTRSITIKCIGCRAHRTDGTMRNDITWLEKIAVEAWNRRP